VWDDNLANAAQQWANQMAQAQDFDHSDPNSRPGQGENLYAYSGTNAVAEFNGAAVDWCNEIANYHGEPIGEGNFESYGHYTQVRGSGGLVERWIDLEEVWTNITRLGGVANFHCRGDGRGSRK
jgi:uncharacterized protein YkwD